MPYDPPQLPPPIPTPPQGRHPNKMQAPARGCLVALSCLVAIPFLGAISIISLVLSNLFGYSFSGAGNLIALGVVAAVVAFIARSSMGKKRAKGLGNTDFGVAGLTAGTTGQAFAASPGSRNEPRSQTTLTAEQKHAQLFQSLPTQLQARHTALFRKVSHLRGLTRNADDFEAQAQLGPGLERLQWLHLKALLALHHLLSSTPLPLKRELKNKQEELQRELQADNLSEAARNSKRITLENTEERLRSLDNRLCRMTEIESDLDRMESQLDLSLEKAALHSFGETGSLQLDLTERMLDTSEIFGASFPLVSELDAHFIPGTRELG